MITAGVRAHVISQLSRIDRHRLAAPDYDVPGGAVWRDAILDRLAVYATDPTSALKAEIERWYASRPSHA